NPCISDPCYNQAGCQPVIVNAATDFACDCLPSFYGTQCELGSPCDSNPCFYGGTCLELGVSFVCQCHQGYAGQQCGEIIPPCQSDPCQNDGSCITIDFTYACICPPEYVGTNCEE
ncbi:putative fat-like cadherin-related tumor suppressor-like, partial [Apostichopus japonicus]